jgi:hypothetical protein
MPGSFLGWPANQVAIEDGDKFTLVSGFGPVERWMPSYGYGTIDVYKWNNTICERIQRGVFGTKGVPAVKAFISGSIGSGLQRPFRLAVRH